jgi:penicillin amidase
MDQQDVYVERLSVCPGFRATRLARAGRAPRCSWHGGHWAPLRTIVDTIRVRGEASREVRLEFTRHGPVVAEDTTRHRGLALRFVGSEPGTAGYLAQLSLDRVRDWPSFSAAAARWKLPTENLVYADVDGTIGWIAAGLMPLRSWSGLLPVPGDGRFEWQGFLPAAELPRAKNPASGFIATANNNILPPGYGHSLNYDWAEPFRANRISGELRDSTGFTREDFERLQQDELSLPARALRPVLRAALGPARPGWPAAVADSVRSLDSWNGLMRQDAAAPLLYAAWVRALRRRVVERLLGPLASRAGSLPGLSVLIGLVTAPDARLGPAPSAARDSLAAGALDDAVAEVTKQLGPDPAAWRWGALHQAAFRHPLAAAFDLPAVPRGGDATTVNATGGSGWRQTSGASYRIVVDFADFDNSTATNVPGQSGQPGSEYYGNLLPLWAGGKYFPLVFSRAAVERETAHVLRLLPPR